MPDVVGVVQPKRRSVPSAPDVSPKPVSYLSQSATVLNREPPYTKTVSYCKVIARHFEKWVIK